MSLQDVWEISKISPNKTAPKSQVLCFAWFLLMVQISGKLDMWLKVMYLKKDSSLTIFL